MAMTADYLRRFFAYLGQLARYIFLGIVDVATGGVLGEALAKRIVRSAERPLEERAQEVAAALTKAGDLLDELQAEVKARSAIIQRLAAEAEEAEQRASDAARRAGLNEQQAKAVDAFLDRALKNRLAGLERNARRREWALATIVALVVGLAAILLAHFVFGF